MKSLIPLSLMLLLLVACDPGESEADAYGNFEANELLYASEMPGKLLAFDAEEGQWLEAGQVIGYVDTVQLTLRREQLLAQIAAILGRTQDIGSQLAVYDEQLRTLDREYTRVEKLVAGEAATSKQLDDLAAQRDLIRQKRQAQLTQMSTANRSINLEVKPLQVQILQINDQIARSVLRSPFKGQVLETYAEAHEMASPGKPLLKLADTHHMYLRAFVSGSQLASLKLGQSVKVLTDGPDGSLQSQEGTLTWIASKAEFTPKTIQTREERVDLVYALKISVPNDEGRLKIGMPGEVSFSTETSQTAQNHD